MTPSPSADQKLYGNPLNLVPFSLDPWRECADPATDARLRTQKPKDRRVLLRTRRSIWLVSGSEERAGSYLIGGAAYPLRQKNVSLSPRLQSGWER